MKDSKRICGDTELVETRKNIQERHRKMRPRNSKPEGPKTKEEGKNWQERTYDESLILAQDERWRRA